MQRQLLALTLTIVCSFALTGSSGVSASSGLSTNGTGVPTASVTGNIRFEGALPKTQAIAMRSDPSCAAEHPQPVRSDDVVVGKDSALENVIVFVSQGVENRTYDLPQNPIVMEQKGCMYEPHVVAMRAGQTLRVVNEDKTTHNIHPMPANNREWNKAQIPGQPIEEKFPREEIAIPVKCNIHPWMHSYIAVFKHPYFAVTGKEGSFTLSSLPPGEYVIEAWHEKLGTMTQKVKVGPGENKNIEFTFKHQG